MDMQDMPTLTMPIYPGRPYKPLNAVIQFETVGIASWRDWITKVVDVLGGRAKTYDRPIVRSLQDAIIKVQVAAKEMGADAIIDMRIGVVSVSAKGLGMSQVLVTGTAIQFMEANIAERRAVASAYATPDAQPALAAQGPKAEQGYGFTFENLDVPQLGNPGQRSSILR